MTGQHVETMQDLLDEFAIRSPQHDAVSAQERATVSALVQWLPRAYLGVVKELRKIASQHHLIDVLVHGDTLSTVVGAIAGRRVGARIVHLESGLTSNALWDPFPEEISRRIVFRLAHIAMCPNEHTLEHMLKSYPRCHAVNTHGNTILDSVGLVGIQQAKSQNQQPYFVASIHRFQNIYDSKRLNSLVEMLEALASRYLVYFVLHPATQKRLEKSNLLDRLASTPNIKLSPRLGYGSFLRLAAGAACVLTDGGSNQEELAAIGTPTIVMRNTTERRDGLGINVVMEKDVPGGITNFLLSGAYTELLTPQGSLSSSPSVAIIDALQQI